MPRKSAAQATGRSIRGGVRENHQVERLEIALHLAQSEQQPEQLQPTFDAGTAHRVKLEVWVLIDAGASDVAVLHGRKGLQIDGLPKNPS